MDAVETRFAEVSNVSYRYLQPEVRRPNHYTRLTIVEVYRNMRFGSLFQFSYWHIYHGGTRFNVDPLLFCVCLLRSLRIHSAISPQCNQSTPYTLSVLCKMTGVG